MVQHTVLVLKRLRARAHTRTHTLNLKGVPPPPPQQQQLLLLILNYTIILPILTTFTSRWLLQYDVYLPDRGRHSDAGFAFQYLTDEPGLLFGWTVAWLMAAHDL